MGKYWVNSYGNMYGNMLVLPVCRIALVSLVRPSVKFRPAKYQAHFLFNRNDQVTLQQLQPLQAMIMDMLTEKYGLRADGTPNAPAMKYPWLREGDEKEYQGFGGTFYIKASASELKKPGCFDRDGKTALDPAQIQNGMLVRPVVTPMTIDDGIAYQLAAVQFVADDGTRYYGGPDPASFLSAVDGAPVGGAGAIGPNIGAAPVVPATPVQAAPVIPPAPQAAIQPVAVLPAVAPVAPQQAAPAVSSVTLNLPIPPAATPPPANGQSVGKGKAAALNML